jgi:hypothetical protein
MERGQYRRAAGAYAPTTRGKLQRRCPTCNAARGWKCTRLINGRPMKTYHQER